MTARQPPETTVHFLPFSVRTFISLAVFLSQMFMGKKVFLSVPSSL